MFKKRNSIITILICICVAFLLCVSIGIIGVKTETNSKVSARADTFNISPNLEVVSEWSYSGTTPNTTFAFSKLTNSNVTSFTYSLENGEIESRLKIERTTTGLHTWELFYAQFKSTVTVPAHTSYKVVYNCKVTGARASGTAVMRAELIGYGQSKNNATYLMLSSGSSGSICQPGIGTETGSKTMVLCNTTDVDKDYSIYFALYNSSGAKTNHVSATCDMTCAVQILKPVAVPTISANLVSVDYYVNGYRYNYETDFIGREQKFYFSGYDTAAMSANYEYLSVKDVGDIDNVYFTLNDGYCWDDEKSGVEARYIYLSIVKGPPVVVVDKIVGCSLPDVVPINSEKSSVGTIRWADDATIDNPKWIFVPEIPEDYTVSEVEGIAEIEYKHINLTHFSAVAASCTEDGSLEYWQCSECEKYFSDADGKNEISLEEVAVEPLGHEMTKAEAVAAKCTTKGTREHYGCSRCGGLFWDSDGNSPCTSAEVIEKELGHDCLDTITAATCKDDGYTTHVCQREGCDYEYTDSYVNALGHGWGEWHTVKEATEEEEGEERRECLRDGCTETESRSIPVLSHTHVFTEWIDGVAATCTENGAAGHYVCTCGKLFDQNHDEIDDITIPALGHTTVIDEAVAATCTESGLTEGSHCSVCNEVLIEQEETPALGHAFEWEITVPPTVDETGLKQNKCSVCGEIDGEEEIAKLVEDPDGNGNVSDLPPDKEYDLEIAVKESDSLYNIPGVNKGFKVELFVVDGENREPYDADKTVNLMLVVPEGMEEFTLYIRRGDILEIVAPESYKVKDRILTIRTTLPNEYVFNAPLPEESEESGGIPWWVWLIVGLAGAAVVGVVTVIIVVIKKKNGGNSDNGEVLKRLGKQDEKIDRLIEISDGGFNDFVDDE